MKKRFWAVIIKPYNHLSEKENNSFAGFCYTCDKRHPEDKRKEQSVRVWAIYPRKKDAISDARFRGGSEVKEVELKLI